MMQKFLSMSIENLKILSFYRSKRKLKVYAAHVKIKQNLRSIVKLAKMAGIKLKKNVSVLINSVKVHVVPVCGTCVVLFMDRSSIIEPVRDPEAYRLRKIVLAFTINPELRRI